MGNRAKRERECVCVDTLGWRREGEERREERGGERRGEKIKAVNKRDEKSREE